MAILIPWDGLLFRAGCCTCPPLPRPSRSSSWNLLFKFFLSDFFEKWKGERGGVGVPTGVEGRKEGRKEERKNN